jgi:predicted metal-dependent enzyme (double-stranded beta helix superfamily)
MNLEMAPGEQVLTVHGLIAALRDARARSHDERAMLRRVRAIARRAARCRSDWLRPQMCQPDPEQGFGIYELHEEDDHQLAVLIATWLPGRGTPPHDHGTWAVVCGLEGIERNTFWERRDDGTQPGFAEIEKLGERDFGAGDAVAMPSGLIHSVCNPTDRLSVSLHIYGRHVNHTLRSRFDPEQRTAVPYRLATVSARAAAQNGGRP